MRLVRTSPPSTKGGEANPDGTFNFVFGYFNRNWVEEPDIPIGPDNNITPGPPDQGQPTHFYPRRARFWFRIQVPKDFGTKEVVWSLTVNGKTEKAYATLKPDYVLEKFILQTNAHMNATGGPPEMLDNVGPVARLEGAAQRTIKVGQPLALTAFVTDDDIPKPSLAFIPSADMTALGLRVVWFVDRGPAETVTFSPEQFTVWHDTGQGPVGHMQGGNSPWGPGWLPPPVSPDGKYSVTATFSTPGVFVVRVLAHDGGLDAKQDVIVTVTP